MSAPAFTPNGKADNKLAGVMGSRADERRRCRQHSSRLHVHRPSGGFRRPIQNIIAEYDGRPPCKMKPQRRPRTDILVTVPVAVLLWCVWRGSAGVQSALQIADSAGAF
jgi:hypothetical protein